MRPYNGICIGFNLSIHSLLDDLATLIEVAIYVYVSKCNVYIDWF